MAFKFQTGTQWVHLPEKHGNWRGVYNRLRMWAIDGTWERVFTALIVQADADDNLNRAVSVDSTNVRAHQHAAGARKRGQRGRPRTRPDMVLADEGVTLTDVLVPASVAADDKPMLDALRSAIRDFDLPDHQAVTEEQVIAGIEAAGPVPAGGRCHRAHADAAPTAAQLHPAAGECVQHGSERFPTSIRAGQMQCDPAPRRLKDAH